MRPFSLTLALGLTLAFSLFASRPARAGCPSSSNAGCVLAADVRAALVPVPGCLELSTDENTCTCSSEVRIINNCAEPLVADAPVLCEFQASCGDRLEPGETGSIWLPLAGQTELGPHTEELALTLGAASYSLALEYDLVYLQREGCAAGGTAGGASAGLVLALAALAGRARSRGRG